MSEIKVGQIYKTKNDRFVITRKYLISNSDMFDLLFINGTVSGFCEEDVILRDAKLIAEYPTWRDAVNSKEFKLGGK